jgi:hypothetical protein
MNNIPIRMRIKGDTQIVSFSEVDEETVDDIKIWSHTSTENKILSFKKPLPEWLKLYPCEAKYFESNNNKFFDRTLIDPEFAHLCGRKNGIRKNGKIYHKNDFL